MTFSATMLDARLSRFTDALRLKGAEYGPDADILLSVAADAPAGGKRMRARFCHAGWSAVAHYRTPEAAETDALWDLCAALEIFQAAALVHDDLIDNSDTRRGGPSAHRVLQAGHTQRDWAGHAESFGRSAAILLGDLLVAWSDDLLEQALESHPQAAAVRALYAKMRRDVTVGQFLDVADESAWTTVPDTEHAERALRIVTFKSARYSVEHPLLLGGALAGADHAQLAALSAFGRPLGIAYQLRDDILGVFGDPAVTGKPAGDDLREGKRTLLVAYVREAVPPGTRQTLDELLGDPDLTPDQIEHIRTTMRETGAVDRVEELIADSTSAAAAALNGAALDNASVSRLRDLARAATTRDA